MFVISVEYICYFSSTLCYTLMFLTPLLLLLPCLHRAYLHILFINLRVNWPDGTFQSPTISFCGVMLLSCVAGCTLLHAYHHRRRCCCNRHGICFVGVARCELHRVEAKAGGRFEENCPPQWAVASSSRWYVAGRLCYPLVVCSRRPSSVAIVDSAF